MNEYRVVRRILMAEEGGGQVRSRPRFSLMDGVKATLGSGEITVEAAQQCTKDRMELRALVNM